MSAPTTNPFQGTAATGTSASITQGTSYPLKSGVQVYALGANTGTVYVGLAGVTAATGYPIEAGKGLFLPVLFFTANGVSADANNLYAIGSAASQNFAAVAL